MNMSKNFIRNSKSYYSLIWLALVIYVVIYAYRTSQWVVCPVANEAFEWGTVKMLHCFIEGINPYSYENFLGSAYVFGPFFPWLCSVFYRIIGFGSDPIIFCRMLSMIFILVSGLLISHIVYAYTQKDRLLAFAAFLAMLVAGFQTAPITAFPPSLAILFYAYTAWSLHQSWGRKLWNIILISLLSILCFYIKQYFLMLLAIVWMYFLIQKQWKNLIYYSIFSILFGAMSIIFLQIYAPTCLYIMVATHAHATSYSIAHLLSQWGAYFIFYLPLIFAIFYCLYTRKKVPVYFLVFLIIASICVSMVGGHTGASYEYFHHLLLMPLVTFGFICYKQLPAKFYNIGLILVVFLSVYHICFIQCCPSVQKDKLDACMNKLKKYEAIDLTNSFNFALTIDDWAYKQGMQRLIFLHTGHILSVINEDKVSLFNQVHSKARPLMQLYKNQLDDDIVKGKADYIFLYEQKENRLSEVKEHPYIPVDTIEVPQGRKTIQEVIVYKRSDNKPQLMH